MAQFAQCIVFIFFMFGCSAVLGLATPCDTKDLEECSKKMVEMNSTSSEDNLCTGILDETLKCYQDILDTNCQMTNGTADLVTKSMDEMKVSKEGCDQKETVTPGKSTCDSSAVQMCAKTQSAQMPALSTNQTEPGMSICGALNSAATCMGDALVNCLDERMKAQLEAMLESVNSNMTDMKCCDVAAIKKCISMEYKITNQSANHESCKKLAGDKPCVVKELKKCEDANAKKMFEEPMNAQLEICESQGYPGSGPSTRPALTLVLASVVTFILSTLIN